MGGGDWNDGMNKVGENGGESVWLGWFLCKVFKCMQYLSDRIKAGIDYLAHLENLTAAIEENAWENDRYLRAFYGDGTPLGSSSCVECEIDSISQSWSAISGVANKERSIKALDTAYTNLVDTSSKTVRLLTPAFSGESKKNTGYISDYPAGIRENGAQYTHAAIWLSKAFYETGNSERGYELL
jgi:cellobiose phosphorylase